MNHLTIVILSIFDSSSGNTLGEDRPPRKCVLEGHGQFPHPASQNNLQSTTRVLLLWLCLHPLPSNLQPHSSPFWFFVQTKLISVSGPQMWISHVFIRLCPCPSRSQPRCQHFRENFSSFNGHWIYCCFFHRQRLPTTISNFVCLTALITSL